MTSVLQALSVSLGCPNCKSGPGESCTQPTDTGRRAVSWVHLARETAYLDSRQTTPPLTGR